MSKHDLNNSLKIIIIKINIFNYKNLHSLRDLGHFYDIHYNCILNNKINFC